MKKIYLVFAILTLISSSQAQFVRGYGIKAGTTISNQNWEYTMSSGLSKINLDPDSRTGFNIGIFAELLNVPFISIVTELNYLQKGLRKEIPVTRAANPLIIEETADWNIRLDYINLSAFGKVRFDAGILSPYILLGPKIDYEINRSSSLEPFGMVDFKKSRIGFKVGVGTEINLPVFNLLAEFLYDADFNELYNNSKLKVNSNSFDIRVGIML